MPVSVSIRKPKTQVALAFVLQKETKENAGTSTGGKANATTPSSSTPNSALSSPRLSLSPRLPSIAAGNPVRRSNSSNQRLGSGLLRQLEVSKSLQPESSHGADSPEPTSPSGSVASETASVASESALLRRRAGNNLQYLLLCSSPTFPVCLHILPVCKHVNTLAIILSAFLYDRLP